MLTPTGLLDAAGRERELTALLALLDELAATAPTAQQTELARLHRHLTLALPGLLAFAPPLDRVQQDAAVVLGDDGVALVAWAWQRRAILGPRRDDLVAQFPPAWQTAARMLTKPGSRPSGPAAPSRTGTPSSVPISPSTASSRRASSPSSSSGTTTAPSPAAPMPASARSTSAA